MNLRKFFVLSPLVLAACSGGASDDPSAVSTTLEEDLAHFSDLYEGEFTNFGIDPEGGAIRHYVYRNIDLPAFGDHVVYVQQYYGAGDGDETATIYRQRIYASYADAERNEIVTKIYSFKDGSETEYVDAQFNPTLLADLTPDDMSTLPDGCEIFWTREGDDIIGYQKEGVCVMEQPGSGAKMLLSDDLKLTSSMFVTKTKGVTEDGDPLFGGDEPLVMYKANIFDCTVSVGEQGGQVRMHDMGGVASLAAFGGSGTAQLARASSEDMTSAVTLRLLDDDGSEFAAAEGDNAAVELENDSATIACRRAEDAWAKPQDAQ